MDHSSFKELKVPEGYRIGVDLIEVSRIAKVYERFQERFVKRILTLAEQEQFSQKKSLESQLAYLAKRWSAKEAFSKALGTGIGKHFSFQDLSVLSQPFSPPSCQVSSLLNARYVGLNVQLSWSDEPQFVVAFCLMSLKMDLRQKELSIHK